MEAIFDSIIEWLNEILISGILSNLSGLFDATNAQVGAIAGQISQTPQEWNSSVFSMIQTLSQAVILPIAGIILTFVATVELIQMIVDRNNLHEVDTWMFFRWVFKTACAVLIVANTWNIVMAVFDVAQSVINSSGNLITSDTAVDMASAAADVEAQLKELDTGQLLGLWFQSLLAGTMTWIIAIAIFVVVYGRMIEIYLTVSLAPIPMATMVNRGGGQMGQNYLRSLFALAFQAFLIMVCVAIYAVLIQSISVSEDISQAIWGCMGYTILLCFALFKTGSLSRSIFSAH